MPVQIKVPATDPDIESSYDAASSAIANLAPYRQYGSQCSHSSWRRVVERIDPGGTNGWAFGGCELQPDAEATVDPGCIIVSVDRYFASAKWYARDWRKGPDAGVAARLYEVKEDGSLALLCESASRKWAQELIGWLRTNRNIPGFSVSGREVHRRGGHVA
jgi:hypothetical protein